MAMDPSLSGPGKDVYLNRRVNLPRLRREQAWAEACPDRRGDPPMPGWEEQLASPQRRLGAVGPLDRTYRDEASRVGVDVPLLVRGHRGHRAVGLADRGRAEVP